MLDDPVRGVRQEAAGALGRLATYEDLALLRTLLQHWDLGVEKAITRALARLATHDDLVLLCGDWRGRQAAAQALPSLVGPQDLGWLHSLLSRYAGDDLTSAVIAAIGQLGEDVDLELLAVEVAKRDCHSPAAIAALTALDRRLYCPFPELLHLGHDEPDESVEESL